METSENQLRLHTTKLYDTVTQEGRKKDWKKRSRKQEKRSISREETRRHQTRTSIDMNTKVSKFVLPNSTISPQEPSLIRTFLNTKGLLDNVPKRFLFPFPQPQIPQIVQLLRNPKLDVAHLSDHSLCSLTNNFFFVLLIRWTTQNLQDPSWPWFFFCYVFEECKGFFFCLFTQHTHTHTRGSVLIKPTRVARARRRCPHRHRTGPEKWMSLCMQHTPTQFPG